MASLPEDPGSAAAAGTAAAAPLYHVAALDAGLALEPETLSYWGYDDGSGCLLVVKGGLLFAYDLSPAAAPGSPEQLRLTFPLPEGPPVVAARLSLDGGMLAVQRSGVRLEMVDIATGNVFVQGTDRGRGELLSFFFTELPGSEVVLVTQGGLELLEFVPRRQGLRLRERIKLPVEWALYTHETRMVLVGTSSGGASFIRAYQFVSSGLVVLPPFTAGAAASALALMGGDAAGGGGGGGAAGSSGGGGGPGSGLVAASPLAAAAVATPPARVGADCLRLIKVYGRVYCAHINRRSLRLELYRFFTDTVVLQHTYELFSPHVELAVVDSVIVAVCTDPAAAAAPPSAPLAGLAMLLDVAAPTSQPIANPLPLRPLRGRDAASGGGGGVSDDGTGAAGAPAAPALRGSGGGGPAGRRRWEYLAPNIVLDRVGQTVYRLGLNLPAIVESGSDPAILVGFLQRRRGPAPPPPLPAAAGAAAVQAAAAAAAAATAQAPKALLLSVVRNALQERMPMSTVRAIFEDLCAGYAAALDRQLAAAWAAAAAAAAAAPAAGTAGAATTAPPPAQPPAAPPGAVPMPQYVTPDELATSLFRWLHDEEVVDAPYLQAALTEYMAAAVAAGVPLPAYLQELWVDILLQLSQAGQVRQMLYSQAEHVAPEVIQHLLAEAPPPAQDAAEVPYADGSNGGSVAIDAEAASGPLPRQFGLDALARGALAARYEPVGAASASIGGAAAASGPAVGADAASYVAALLAGGDVLRAARVMRRYRVSAPSVKEFIAAVGATGNEAALVAVYRIFQEELLACYPKYELAARKLLARPPSPTQAVPEA